MRDAMDYFDLPYNPSLRQRAKELRKAGNLCETLLWRQVQRKKFKGYDFDRQKVISNYIVDFYCANCRVVIEIDGVSHDGKGEYDQERDRFLEELGLTVIHVPAGDILSRLDDAMQMLYDHPAFQAPSVEVK